MYGKKTSGTAANHRNCCYNYCDDRHCTRSVPTTVSATIGLCDAEDARPTYFVKSRLQNRQFSFAGDFSGVCEQILPSDLIDGERSDLVDLLSLVVSQ